MNAEERDSLMHLVRDWEAQAAHIERQGLEGGHLARAEILRGCATRLKTVLAELGGMLP